MASERKNFTISEGVYVTDEVVTVIAGLAATEVPGVDSLAGNIKNHAIEKTGISTLSKRVRIIPRGNNELSVHIAINILYGYEIEDVCNQIQDKIKSTIETMTGMKVLDVDIKISSVVLENME